MVIKSPCSKQERIFDFVTEILNDKGYSSSIRQVAARRRISARSTVAYNPSKSGLLNLRFSV